MVNLDGSDRHFILETDGSGYVSEINKFINNSSGETKFTPDGLKIYFYTSNDVSWGSASEIYKINIDGSGLEILVHIPQNENIRINFLHDMSGFVYSKSPEQAELGDSAKIYLHDFENNNTTFIIDGLYPVVSPDDSKILYLNKNPVSSSDLNIYICNIDGSNEIMLYGYGNYNFVNNEKIIVGDDEGIFLLNIDGSGSVKIREPYRNGHFFDNYSKVIYSSGNPPEVFIENVDESERIRILNGVFHNVSPDNIHFAYYNYQVTVNTYNTIKEVYIRNIQTGESYPLNVIRSAIFSPDGSKLLFSCLF